jgi:ABC-type Na+ efflux pump permease subunit
MLWLASRGEKSSRVAWALALFTVGGIAILVNSTSPKNPFRATLGSVGPELAVAIFIAVMNSLMNILVASQACRCLAEARRNTTLEVVLCTPLRVEQILQGQVLALKRLFLRPMLLVLAAEATGIFALFYANSGGLLNTRALHTVFVAEAAFIIFFFLELQAVAWVGMWFGLCSKNESRAVFKTIFYIILLPHALLVLYSLGAILFFAWPILGLAWARLNLQEHFRGLAGHRATSGRETMGWVPLELPALAAQASANLSQPT